jgi:signal peptidase II
VLAFVLDQASKLAVVLLPFGYPGWRSPLLQPGPCLQQGAAFSFLADQGGWQRWFFAVLAFAICGLLIHWLRKQSVTQRWSGIAYSLIIGGALGNVFDRLVLGHVVDFLDFTGSAPTGRRSIWPTASSSSVPP